MSEKTVIDRTTEVCTVNTLCRDFEQIGMRAGHTVLVHSSMSKLGFVVGGPQSVINALLEVLGTAGTLMMPTHTGQNTDPANWRHPPVPEAWWSDIRTTMPAYDPDRTPSRGMGAIAELFRTYPQVNRSAHPIASFAATGPQASALLEDHSSLTEMFGEASPVGKLYALDGYVLLLGVTHSNNTSMHLAEYRAAYSGKRYAKEGSAQWIEGERKWTEFEMLAVDSDDFEAIGADYTASQAASEHICVSKIGMSDSTYLRQRPLVDFTANWMSTHRTAN